MIVDEIREQLKMAEPNVSAIRSFWQNAAYDNRYDELHAVVHEENFWQHKDHIALAKEYQHLKELKDQFDAVTSSFDEQKELLELFATDEAQLASLARDVTALCKKISSFKLSLMLSKPDDQSDCFVAINAGAGGTESQDWANMLLRMYLRFCERENLSASIVDIQGGEEAGIKSATIYIKGKNAQGTLRGESGIHRLVRISPFDASKRRHTSFAGVTVTPEVEEADIEVRDDDLRIDTYRAGGAGGQHVNKTDSAVRITHLPTNIVVQCQNERSQHQNKRTALKMLAAKLAEKQAKEREAEKKSQEKKKIEWGSQIRSYVLHPYKMVKDHRTGHESPQPDRVLDGELVPFVEAYLVHQASE